MVDEKLLNFWMQISSWESLWNRVVVLFLLSSGSVCGVSQLRVTCYNMDSDAFYIFHLLSSIELLGPPNTVSVSSFH